jgi:hypothetical protein
MPEEKEQKRIVEIGGAKVEIDLREATTVETYKPGDPVHVLVKRYGDSYEAYPAIVVGFHAFKTRPTIVVAYLKDEGSFSGVDIHYAYLNKDTDDTEICPRIPGDRASWLSRATLEEKLNRMVQEAERKLAEATEKRDFFQKWIGVICDTEMPEIPNGGRSADE